MNRLILTHLIQRALHLWSDASAALWPALASDYALRRFSSAALRQAHALFCFCGRSHIGLLFVGAYLRNGINIGGKIQKLKCTNSSSEVIRFQLPSRPPSCQLSMYMFIPTIPSSRSEDARKGSNLNLCSPWRRSEHINQVQCRCILHISRQGFPPQDPAGGVRQDPPHMPMAGPRLQS